MFLLYDRYLGKKFHVPKKLATISSVTIKSYNALLRMLLLFILSYIKSALKRVFLIFDTYHPNIPYLCE